MIFARGLLLSGLIFSIRADLLPIGFGQPLEGTRASGGSPWPLPQDWRSTNDLVSIGSMTQFKYVLNVENCEPLDWAIKKYNYEFLFGKYTIPDTTFPTVGTVYVTVSNGESNECHKFPKLSRDKTYESCKRFFKYFGIGSDNAGFVFIHATTVWGALRGLETFSQLWFTRDWESPQRHFYANVTEINDWPRFPHRGLMIDTARHYLLVSTILEILDAMLYNKLNVLHWHIVDDQSFPFVSTTFPELSNKGAFTSEAIYTPENINEVLNAGRMRGIRIVFEFDTPGHTHAMGYSHPEVLTPCYGDGETPGTPNYPIHAARENLDPTRESTYTFMKQLFEEIIHVSEDEYVHLGMDEVYYPCWNSSPEIKTFMNENGYKELNQVQGYYTDRHINMVNDLGAKAIIWQDPIDEGVELHSEVVVQMWKDWGIGGWMNATQQVLDAGYQVLISAPWYLNYISYGPTWRQYYEVDPVFDLVNIKPGQEEQILGGEVCMWSEYVDSTNIVPRLFPFSSAVAERLWSPPNSSTTDDAMWRLDEQRCRLLWRQIPAQPIYNGFCGPWEVDNNF